MCTLDFKLFVPATQLLLAEFGILSLSFSCSVFFSHFISNSIFSFCLKLNPISFWPVEALALCLPLSLSSHSCACFYGFLTTKITMQSISQIIFIIIISPFHRELKNRAVFFFAGLLLFHYHLILI